MKTAAIYVQQAEHRDELMQLVVEHGWKLVDVYTDTGRRDRRPGRRYALLAARRRRFDILVVYRAEVLALSLHELVNTLARLQRCNVELVSATERLEAITPDAVGALAKFARDVKATKTAEGMRRARGRGRHVGRPRRGLDETIVALRRAGVSIRAIASRLECGQGTVQRALERAEPYRKGSLHEGAQVSGPS